MRYAVGAGSRLTVKARSSVHDSTTVWTAITGEIDADPDALTAAIARITVDMTVFDAGDWLKNRKLRNDFELDRNPRASFELRGVTDLIRDDAAFTARATGTLSWRGRQVVLALAGRGTLDAMRISATATFELDITELGLAAPRFLMFKVEDQVTVEVVLHGTAVSA